MPSPKNYKSRKTFLQTCIPQLIKEGKPQDQAAAICYSMWKDRKKNAKAAVDVGDDELIFEDDKGE